MLSHPRHRTSRPSGNTSLTPTTPTIAPAPEDGLDKLCLSDPHGIEVEDISLVEFVREWGRAVTHAALAHAIEIHSHEAE
jgi:hypothetical protein